MKEVIKLIIGILFLLLGIPIGNWLSRTTKEELKRALTKSGYKIIPKKGEVSKKR